MHVGGVSHRTDLRRNSDFYARIFSTIDDGADWPQLRAALGGTHKIRPVESITISKRPRWQQSKFESSTI
jgi:hypothetical protein